MPNKYEVTDFPPRINERVTCLFRTLESNPVLLLFERSLKEVLFTKSIVIKAVTQTQFETCVTAFILLIS